MAQGNLKVVLSLDPATTRFKPTGHNLTAEKAEAQAQRLKKQGLEVKVLDQPSRHTGRFTVCSTCQTACQNLSEQEAKQPEDEQQA